MNLCNSLETELLLDGTSSYILNVWKVSLASPSVWYEFFTVMRSVKVADLTYFMFCKMIHGLPCPSLGTEVKKYESTSLIVSRQHVLVLCGLNHVGVSFSQIPACPTSLFFFFSTHTITYELKSYSELWC